MPFSDSVFDFNGYHYCNNEDSLLYYEIQPSLSPYNPIEQQPRHGSKVLPFQTNLC